MDVYRRYVVGGMVAHRESTDLAKKLIAETYMTQEILPGQRGLHVDRGRSMTSKGVGEHDNPVSEAQLKTLKDRLEFPDRFVREMLRGSMPAGEVWINKPNKEVEDRKNPVKTRQLKMTYYAKEIDLCSYRAAPSVSFTIDLQCDVRSNNDLIQGKIR